MGSIDARFILKGSARVCVLASKDSVSPASSGVNYYKHFFFVFYWRVPISELVLLIKFVRPVVRSFVREAIDWNIESSKIDGKRECLENVRILNDNSKQIIYDLFILFMVYFIYLF